MAEPNAKRARLSMTDVLLELDNEDDEPMTVGSDDEFEDITYIEKERDEWGAVEHEITKETNPILSHSPLYPSVPSATLSVHSSLGLPVPVSQTLPPHSALGPTVPGGQTLPPHSALGQTVPGDQTLPPHSALGPTVPGGQTLLPHSALSQTVPGGQTLPPHSALGPTVPRDQTLPPHSALGPTVPGGQTLPPHSALSQTVPGGQTLPPHSALGPTVPGRQTRPPHSALGPTVPDVDPFSLPLSTYFSHPLSTLTTLLQSAFTPPAHTAAHAPSPAHTAAHAPPSATTHPAKQTPPVSRSPQRRAQSRSSYPATSTTSPGSWSSTLSPVGIAPFVQPVGPTVAIPESELDVFGLFFTDEICGSITEQTNLYAQQVLGEKYGEWKKVTVEELRAYFGFMLLMGLYPKPATSDYWRRDPFVNYAPIADRIPRDRFYEIQRYLHFADNSLLPQRGEPGYDRLGKVRPIMEQLQKKFLELYQPHCENAIDEAMIPFQGRSSLKQYMPAKPVKRGIKVWYRADSHNGYMCETQVYTGKSDGVEGGLGKRVILDLSKTLEGKKYHLYFDNFFSSVSLLTTLLEKGLYACVTARQNYRDFPSALKMQGKSKAEMQRHGLANRLKKYLYCILYMHTHCTPIRTCSYTMYM